MAVVQLDVILDRPLPQSLDEERAVLGSVLLNNNAFYRVIGLIDTEDFFKDAHRTIFATMRSMAQRSMAIEPLTLKEELTEHGRIDSVGGIAYIFSLIDGVAEDTDVERYARIIEEKATRRRLTGSAAVGDLGELEVSIVIAVPAEQETGTMDGLLTVG